MSVKVEDALNKLATALQRLGDALAQEGENPLFVDATIQRFEFVFELTWKALKRALEIEGFICRTPRETLKTAYQAGWIHDEILWLQMLDDRNLTAHTYDESTALQICENIKVYFPRSTGSHNLFVRKLLLEPMVSLCE
jgi:nucleotidyltransferase substrate binding protein (TIGR01987 family)